MRGLLPSSGLEAPCARSRGATSWLSQGLWCAVWRTAAASGARSRAAAPSPPWGLATAVWLTGAASAARIRAARKVESALRGDVWPTEAAVAVRNQAAKRVPGHTPRAERAVLFEFARVDLALAPPLIAFILGPGQLKSVRSTAEASGARLRAARRVVRLFPKTITVFFEARSVVWELTQMIMLLVQLRGPLQNALATGAGSDVTWLGARTPLSPAPSPAAPCTVRATAALRHHGSISD